jgi:hypothetical protein
MARKRLEQGMNRPGRFKAENTSEVRSLPEGPASCVGDDEKARGVVGVVLDIGREDVQAVKLRRRITRNGTGLRVFAARRAASALLATGCAAGAAGCG